MGLALLAHFTLGRTAKYTSVADLALASLAFGAGTELYGTASWAAVVLSVCALVVMYLWMWFMFLATAAFHVMEVSDQVRAWGFHWLKGQRLGVKKYAHQSVLPSGRLQHEDEVVETRRRVVVEG